MKLKKVVSEFEFRKVPLKKVDLKAPVVVIMEYHDGYHYIMLKNKHTDKIDGSMLEASVDYLDVQEYDSLQDFLEAEYDNDTTLEEDIKNIYSGEYNCTYDAIIEVTKLTGFYSDPENIFNPPE